MVLDEGALRALVREALRDVLREELPRLLPGSTARPTYLSPKQAADVAATSVSTIRSWIRGGRLRPYRAGRLVRVRRDEVEALLAGGKVGGDSRATLAATIISKGRR
ncbi:MAG: helix-turn-helix domain-containing protein [Myxococcales bacterium]|jgi:excisionase family DNA binding protein|nr:helix-turn-helix domain-containing protein [Myxococcales bacterium]